MQRAMFAGVLVLVAVAAALKGGTTTAVAQAPQQTALPAPASRPIDFSRDIKPILTTSCVKCHARGQAKGGFSMETREALLAGGDMGPAVIPGNSEQSHLIALVAGLDPDIVMPQKGSRLKSEQVALLRAWIDQGLAWDEGVTFAKSPPRNLQPRLPILPGGGGALPLRAVASHATHPVDRLLEPYFARNGMTPGEAVDDRVFARRAYFDVVGLPPSPAGLRAFVADRRPDKRALLVKRLLADRARYAGHWLTFWNDMLRNDYRGTGYIDGGRRQISAWLYRALATNLPYDRFVAELVNPGPDSEGFTRGIVWRGVVNASQTPQMQAAQNISQVFMGVNLKCASCHDSFINDWQLSDAYGLAGIYADAPLEMVQCDRPLGRTAPMKFLYKELGNIAPDASRAERLKQLEHLITGRQNGRLTRTIVNRLWARFLGRGLVEPVDDMEQAAWHPDLLDWLAEDLAGNGYDLKKTIERILTSRAYQMTAVDVPEREAYVFRGPAIRRLSAEQFADALSAVTGVWYQEPAGDFDFTVDGRVLPPLRGRWIWKDAAPAPPAGETLYVRKRFFVNALPATAHALVSYDNLHTIYVNGQRVTEARGSNVPRLIDIRPQLRRGPNVVAIAATAPLRAFPLTGLPIKRSATRPAALFAQVLTRRSERSPLEVALASDATWRWSAMRATGWEGLRFADGGWAFAMERVQPRALRVDLTKALNRVVAAATLRGRTRAALATADPLMVALGRPNREQVITTRTSAATTLQALELANGGTLARSLGRGAARLLADVLPGFGLAVAKTPAARDALIERVYLRALGRRPTAVEAKLSRDLLGPALEPEGVEDLLWSIVMLPEFQLVY